MGIPVVQVADPETNTTFSTLPGVFSLTVTRGGQSSPGLLEMSVSADVESDARVPTNPADFNSDGGALVLLPNEGGAFWMARDENSNFAYVTAGNLVGPPGHVIKIQLNASGPPTRVDSISFTDVAEQSFRSIAVDGNGEYVYAVTGSNPARVIKIRASDMTRVTSVDLSALAGKGGPCIASSAGDRLYVISDNHFTQFNTNGAGLVEMGALLLNDNWGNIKSIRGLGTFIYGVGNLADGQVAFTRFTLPPAGSAPGFMSTKIVPGATWAQSVDLLTNNTAYIACNSTEHQNGQAKIIKMDIGGTYGEKLGEITLPVIDRGVFSLDADPATGYLYVLHRNPMKLVKIDPAGSMTKVSTTLGPTGHNDAFTVVLHGGNAYATTTVKPAAIVKFNLSNSGATPAPGSLNRWYPFLGVRVVELDDATGEVTPNTRMFFTGRVDEAKLIEDGDTGRYWKVTARDWLSVLADNYVDKGKWYAKSAGRGTAFVDGQQWEPVYVGNWSNDASGFFGERRQSIISDLALNVIASAHTGLGGVVVNQAPNSRRIQADWRGRGQISVLDAIRELAASDPWYVDGEGTPIGPLDGDERSVDALWLYQNNFPDGSGFGGEFQIQCDIVANSGRVATYFRRGSISSGKYFSYGPFPGSGSVSGSDVLYIIEHSFDKQGFDIFSRTRVQGKGEASADNTQQNIDDGLTGTAIAVKEMEEEWNPALGRFRVRREGPNRDQGRNGEWEYSAKEDGNDATTARSLRDAAYASMVSGQSGLENTRGGLNRGSVTVSDLPINSLGGVIQPGTLAGLYIPHAGISDPEETAGAMEFVIESWTMEWPATVTTFVMARQSYSEAGQALLRMARMANDNASGLNDGYVTTWFPVASDGQMNITHKLGVKPSKVTIEVGLWDGEDIDPNGQPIPILGTTVQVQGHHWDPAEGQHVGASITKVSAEAVGLSYAYNIAYSDGAGMWLTTGNARTLTRFRVYP